MKSNTRFTSNIKGNELYLDQYDSLNNFILGTSFFTRGKVLKTVKLIILVKHWIL